MKALALTEKGGTPQVVDVEDPKPGAGEVLVRVAAASLNAYDLFVANGMAGQFLTYEYPVVIGSDVAGVVEALGDGAEGFAVGERVFGMMGMKGVLRDGAFGELATPQAGSLAKTPDGVGDGDAASLGVAGTTAMSAVDAVGADAGDAVLVVGATGGVGSFAVQILRERGAAPIATIRPDDDAFVTDLGAADTADYTLDVAAQVRERYPNGVDGVIDAVNRDSEAFGAMVALVKPGGRAVSVVGAAGEATDIGGVAVANTGGDPGHLDALAALVRDGKLRVPIKKAYALDEAAQALQDFVNEHTLGKLVIAIR